MKLKIQPYDEKRFVLRGHAMGPAHKAVLKMGGRWNPNLRGGEGYLFLNKDKRVVVQFTFKYNMNVSRSRPKLTIQSKPEVYWRQGYRPKSRTRIYYPTADVLAVAAMVAILIYWQTIGF